MACQGTAHLGRATLALQQPEQLPLGPCLHGAASVCQREELKVPAQAGCRAEGEWQSLTETLHGSICRRQELGGPV